MCQNSNADELYQLAQEDIANGELTQDQLESMDEDVYTLACLRAKAKKINVPVGDLVDVWLDQDGKCKQCEYELFPTASTRSFYHQEDLPGDSDDEDDNLPNEQSYGCFVCPDCKY